MDDETAQCVGVQIVLRDPIMEDLRTLSHWLQPGHRWQELDGPYYPKPTPDETATMMGRLRDRIAAQSFSSPRQSLIVALRETNVPIGRVTWYWESQETNWLSMGIVLYDPDSWGKGLGYEALGLWGSYLLSDMPDVVRLDLRTWSGNPAMARLATKLGFAEEARFRNARIVHGEYFDGLGFGMLREEWQARYPNGFASFLQGGSSGIGALTT